MLQNDVHVEGQNQMSKLSSVSFSFDTFVVLSLTYLENWLILQPPAAPRIPLLPEVPQYHRRPVMTR